MSPLASWNPAESAAVCPKLRRSRMTFIQYVMAMEGTSTRMTGLLSAALTAATEPYLPVVRVFALLGPAWSPAQRERLIQRVEATLRSENLI